MKPLILLFLILLVACSHEHDHTHDHSHPLIDHEHEHVHPVEGDTPLPYVIMRVRSPHLRIIDPNEVKIDDINALNGFFEGHGHPPVAVLLKYPEVPVNGQHLIHIDFSRPPRNFRITERSDRLMAHWFVEPTELRLRVFCGLDPLDGDNGQKMVLEWDSGSETLFTWCEDP